MLLTGDLCGDYEMYACYPADVLKAAHHGSSGSTSEAFLAGVSPKTILLSCGKESRESGFRNRTGREDVLSTRSCGAITIRFRDHGQYELSTWLKQE